jgi:hypothetical protein
MGREGIFLVFFLPLCWMEISGQAHASVTLTPNKNLRYPLDGRGLVLRAGLGAVK